MRPADVLCRALTDLDPTTVWQQDEHHATVCCQGTSFDLHVAARGRGLLQLTETTFVLPVGPMSAPCHLTVTQQGVVRGGDPRVRVRKGGASAARLGQRLASADWFDAVVRTLDFTCLELRTQNRMLQAEVTLMGAAGTRLRLPPVRHYTRLHVDQRAALIDLASQLADLDLGDAD